MKKIFTLIAAVFMAVGANAQTAKDAYLDVTKYATLDDATINIKNAAKVYSWNDTKKVLVVSAYAIQQSSQKNQDEGKDGFGWMTYTNSNSAGASWNATGDFNGSAYYGTISGGSASDRGLNTKNHYSFFVTNCSKVSALVHSKSKSRTVTMDVYPVTFSGTTATRGDKAGTAGDNTNAVTTIFVDELDVSKIYEIDVYSSDANGGHLYELAFYSTEIVTPPTPATTWDFTQNLSTSDATNLAADDTNWTDDIDNGYYSNAETLTTRNVFIPLKANDVELDITKGLTFTRDNEDGLGPDRVRIAPSKYFAINGSAVLISLGELAKNDIIRMKMKGAGDTERSLTVTNATVTDGSMTTTDTNVHEVALKVDKDGAVTFRTSNGFQFMAISINAALPTGINDVKVVEPATANGAIFNLSGQKVNESYKGVVIKNGKKVVVK